MIIQIGGIYNMSYLPKEKVTNSSTVNLTTTEQSLGIITTKCGQNTFSKVVLTFEAHLNSSTAVDEIRYRLYKNGSVVGGDLFTSLQVNSSTPRDVFSINFFLNLSYGDVIEIKGVASISNKVVVKTDLLIIYEPSQKEIVSGNTYDSLSGLISSTDEIIKAITFSVGGTYVLDVHVSVNMYNPSGAVILKVNSGYSESRISRSIFASSSNNYFIASITGTKITVTNGQTVNITLRAKDIDSFYKKAIFVSYERIGE